MNPLTVTPTMRHDIRRVFGLQRAARQRARDRTAAQRIKNLIRLRAAIVAHSVEIDAALYADLRKPLMGADHFEITGVLGDIDDAVANLAGWMADEVIEPSPHFAGNRTFIMYEPRGVVLLFGAWNFPFGLTFGPLIPIIAAGNTAIVKPNELQPATSAIIATIIRETFEESEVAVFEGGVDLAEALLSLPVDHVFFTGSPAVGKRVMAAAAQHLASVTLELGGKCPAIIDRGWDLTDAAAKIVGARFFNAGQLCLAVDHVWVPAELRDQLVDALRAAVDTMFYVDGVLQTDRFSRIVDARNFGRVTGYLDDAVARGARIVHGGGSDESDLTLHPTILVDVPLDSSLMIDEIFGPILPVLSYHDVADVFETIDASGKPLALYVFSDDDEFVDRVLHSTSSGGVTVNNVLLHYSENRLPFGGVNQSGMGCYKGVHGFRELSHARSVLMVRPTSDALE